MPGFRWTEVAERYGVSRQSVHTWLRRYRQEGISGLEDRSHQVHGHPWRIPVEVEEAVCELRRGHPGWGPRRLAFEMGRRGYGTVTRSTSYRTWSAAEIHQFLTQWLTRDSGHLVTSLAEFVGHPAYGLPQLRQDLERFIFLLGGSDGKPLFGSITPGFPASQAYGRPCQAQRHSSSR